MSEFHAEWNGFCPICQQRVKFTAKAPWYRGSLVCPKCPNGSVPRERALALVLREVLPNWPSLKIHESSPAARGISVVLKRDAPRYLGSHFFPDKPLGSIHGAFQNENIEKQTFRDEEFDIVISLDVMEHIYNPDAAFGEIYRTLKKGGVYICTFPVRNGQVRAWERRFEIEPDGSRKDLKPPEIHGNPIDKEGGSIVTVDYGYDIHKQISEWAPFAVRILRFADPYHGIIGEFTEVVVATKF